MSFYKGELYAVLSVIKDSVSQQVEPKVYQHSARFFCRIYKREYLCDFPFASPNNEALLNEVYPERSKLLPLNMV